MHPRLPSDVPPDSASDPVRVLLAHRSFLRALVRSLARSDAEADELEQDAWLAMLRRAPAELRDPRRWIAAFVRGTARTRWRARDRRRFHETAAAAERAPAATAAAPEGGEASQRVARAVLALREPYRTAVLDRYYHGEAPSATARRLGVSRQTVKTRLRRALVQLREELSSGDEDLRALLGDLDPPWTKLPYALALAAGLLGVALLARALAGTPPPPATAAVRLAPAPGAVALRSSTVAQLELVRMTLSTPGQPDVEADMTLGARVQLDVELEDALDRDTGAALRTVRDASAATRLAMTRGFGAEREREWLFTATSPRAGTTFALPAGEPRALAGLLPPDGRAVAPGQTWTLPAAALAPVLAPGGDLAFAPAHQPTWLFAARFWALSDWFGGPLEGTVEAELVERTADGVARIALAAHVACVSPLAPPAGLPPDDRVRSETARVTSELHARGELRWDVGAGRVLGLDLAGPLTIDLSGERELDEPRYVIEHRGSLAGDLRVEVR